jgi:hypothetical protein
VEEVRVRELAQAKGKLLEIQNMIQEHQSEESDFLGMYGEFEKSEVFTTDQVMAYCEFKEWLLRREKDYRRREKEWGQEVDRRRQTAVKASRARQRQKRTHAQEVLGEEQRFLDEISSIAYVRRDRAKLAANAGLVENLGR